MVQKGIVFLMVGLLSVSVLGGAALASIVTASTQDGYRNPCVLSSYNPQASTFSNNTIPMGIWVTWTSLNGTVHHECDGTAPNVYGNGTAIIFTQIPSGGIPPGYGMSCSFTSNTEGCTISPPSTGTPYTGPPPVNQNTTQTTTSTH
jgi:hypothetical protein